MELLIFSDSHGNINAMKRALERQIKRPDAVCFLGDGLSDAESLEGNGRILWHCVRGNCDWGVLGDGYPTDRILELEGHRLLLTHGHFYGVKEGCARLLMHALEIGADIVLYGHTHEPMLCTLPAGEEAFGIRLPKTIYLFNPGSIGRHAGSFGTLLLREQDVLFSHGSV